MKKVELNTAGIPTLLQSQKTSPFNRSWIVIAVITMIAFMTIVWMTGSRSNPWSIPQESILNETNVQGSLLPVKEFPKFIAGANASDVPRTFISENLYFGLDSSFLIEGAEEELNQISMTLENSPLTAIRIEGFPDNNGDLTQRKDLAFKRALAVKEQLVSRGINPDRIDTVGNVSGNQRITFIVTSVE